RAPPPSACRIVVLAPRKAIDEIAVVSYLDELRDGLPQAMGDERRLLDRPGTATDKELFRRHRHGADGAARAPPLDDQVVIGDRTLDRQAVRSDDDPAALVFAVSDRFDLGIAEEELHLFEALAKVALTRGRLTLLPPHLGDAVL